MSKNLLSKLDAAFNSGDLFEFVDNSLAATQVLNKLGFSSKGQYIGIVRKYLIDNEFDISHFTTNGLPAVPYITKVCLNCNKEFKCQPKKTREQVTCSRACSNTVFRSKTDNGNYISGIRSYRKYALEYYGCKCMVCGYDNELGIEVHHIDRNRENNDMANLEVLCANCHLVKHKTGT